MKIFFYYYYFLNNVTCVLPAIKYIEMDLFLVLLLVGDIQKK